MEQIFEKLGNDLLTWLKDLSSLFERQLKKITATVSWEFLNKQISRKIDKWYDIIQDAVDETELYLYEQDIDNITPEIEKNIREVFQPKLKEYQEKCNVFLEKYFDMRDNIDKKIWNELVDITFEITIDNIINIIKEVLNEK